MMIKKIIDMKGGAKLKIKSDKIKLLIAREGLSMKDFSKKIGISNSWLSNLLLREEASPNMVTKISQGLDVKVDNIVEYDSD